jgi:hypothetical protein
MTTVTEDEVSELLARAADTMPLSSPEWSGPSMHATHELPAKHKRAVLLAIAASIAAAATWAAVTTNGDSRTVASGGSGSTSATSASTSTASATTVPTTTPTTSPTTTSPTTTSPTTSTAPSNPNTGGSATASASQCGSGASALVGSGNVVTQRRPIEAEASAVVVSGCAEVMVRQGEGALTIATDDNVIDRITTTVVDGRLVIGIDDAVRVQTGKLPSIIVTLPNIAGASIDGTGTVSLVDVSGDQISLAVSGAGKLTASGKTTNLGVTVAGAGTVDASGLSSATAEASVSGAGQVSVQANVVNATVSGTGTVRVVNASARITAKTTGVGTVVAADGTIVSSGPPVPGPSLPTTPKVPTVPTIPKVPSVPKVPTVPTIPDVSIPPIPDVPDVPSVPAVPSIPRTTKP